MIKELTKSGEPAPNTRDAMALKMCKTNLEVKIPRIQAKIPDNSRVLLFAWIKNWSFLKTEYFFLRK